FTVTATLRFDVLGDSLRLFFNGGLIASTLDNRLMAPGLVGVRGAATSFDNFAAARLVSALPFSDTFGRPDSANIGEDYLERAGDLSILFGQLATAQSGVNLAVYTRAYQADVSVQANINLATAGFTHAGLVARYANATPDSAAGATDTNMY